MQNSRIWAASAAVVTCLQFTGQPVVRADSARPAAVPAVSPWGATAVRAGTLHDDDDPPTDLGPPEVRGPAALRPTKLGPAFALHDTWGPTARVGTVVGTVEADVTAATGLGLSVAGGHRFGRLTVESELAMIRLQEQGSSSLALGQSARLGVIVRYDVVRLGSRMAGPNTMIAMFVEGGAAQTWNHWYEPAANELPRAVPLDTRRVEGQAGLGVAIDHRILQPAGFPNRIAWHLGWRFAAPSPVRDEVACRGSCRIAATPMQASSGSGFASSVQASVMFQSSLAFTW